MIRRYRKRRRMKMRRRPLRRRRYSRKPRIPRFDEVKLNTIGLGDQALKMQVPGVGDTVMYPQGFIWSNILNRIVKGTDYDQRVGSQIYVLSIKFKANVWLCTDTDGRYLNTGLFRVIVGEPIGTELTSSFQNFFRSPGMRDKTLQPLNRKTYTFHYDRTYRIDSGYFNTNLVATAYSGAIRHVEFNIPINRKVEYTTNNIPKNQRDQISMFVVPWVPNGALIDNAKVMCSNWVATTYYVDA